MLMYHGTNMLIGAVDLYKCKLRTDFGKGFYLSDKIGTAQRWAIRRVELLGGTPTVLRYEVSNDIFTLHGQRYPDIPSPEWLRFICGNRELDSHSAIKQEPRHDYNWISGPIADDKIADVVEEYMANEITEDEAIRRARTLPQTFQLSVHTAEGISYMDDENVCYRQLKNGRWTKSWIKRNIIKE